MPVGLVERSDRRNGRWRRAAFVLVTAALILAVGELAAWIGLSIRLGRPATLALIRQARQEVRAPSQPGAQTREDRASEAAQLQADTVVHPFLGFVLDREFHRTLRERRGGRESVEHGFSLHRPGLFIPPRDSQIVVGVSGGSVAFSLALRSGELLEAALSARAPTSVESVRVVNLALPGFKQPQQLMTMTWFLALGAHFDAFVNLDGFNEVTLPAMEHRSKGVFPAFPRGWYFAAEQLGADLQLALGEIAVLHRRRATAAAVFGRPPLCWSFLGGLLWSTLDSRLEHRARAAELQLISEGPSERGGYGATGPSYTWSGGDRMYEDLATFWARCSRQMERAASANRIAYVHFLQPNQHVPGSKPMSEAERKVALASGSPFARHAELGYPHLVANGRRLVSEGVDFHDLSMVFADVPEPVYSDSCCHFNEHGEALVVDAIADGLAEKLGWSSHGP